MIDFLKDHWAEIGVVYLTIMNVLKGLRDALDKTPLTDDNAFERTYTVIMRLGGYLFTGKRADGK